MYRGRWQDGIMPTRERFAWLPVPLWELYQDEYGVTRGRRSGRSVWLKPVIEHESVFGGWRACVYSQETEENKL